MINRPTRRSHSATIADSAHALTKLTQQAQAIMAAHTDIRNATRAARAMAIIWQIALDIRPKAPDPGQVEHDGGTLAHEGSLPNVP